MPRKKRILITILIGGIVLLGIMVGSVLFLNTNISRIKTTVISYVEKNSVFKLDIRDIGVNFFSSVSLKGIVLGHKYKELSFTADSITVKYRFFDIVFHKINFIDSIRLIEVKGVTVQASDLGIPDLKEMFFFKSGSDDSLIKARMVFLDSRIIYQGNGIGTKWNITSLMIDPRQKEIHGQLNSRIYMEAASLKWDTDVRGDFSLDVTDKTWSVKGDLSDAFFNQSVIPDLVFSVQGSNSSPRGVALLLHKGFKADMKFDHDLGMIGLVDFSGWDISPFIQKPYRIYGKISSKGTVNRPVIHADLKALNTVEGRKLNLFIRNSRLKDLVFWEEGAEKLSCRVKENSHEYEGVISSFKLFGKKVNGKFVVATSPNSGIITLRSLDIPGYSFFRNYQLDYRVSPSLISLLSRDGRLSARINTKKFASSIFSIDLSAVSFMSIDKKTVWNLDGKGLWTPEKFSISNLSLGKNGDFYLSSLLLKYDFKKAEGNFVLTIPILKTGLKGELSHRNDKWEMVSKMTVVETPFPLVASLEKQKGRTQLSLECGSFLKSTLFLWDSFEFRMRSDVYRSPDSPLAGTSGIITARGNILDIRGISAQADLRTHNLRYGPWNIPLSVFKLFYKTRNLDFKADLIGKAGKTVHAEGTYQLPNTLLFCDVSLDSVTPLLKFDRRSGKRSVSLQLKNFDLQQLEPFLDANSISKISGRISVDMLLSQNNAFSLWTYFDNVTMNDLVIQQGSISGRSKSDAVSLQKGTLKILYKDYEGRIMIHDGLIRNLEDNTVFTSILDFDFKNASSSYTGLLNLTGRKSSSTVNLKTSFSQLRFNQYTIPRYEQYFRWNKDLHRLDLSTDSGGLQGSVFFRVKPSFSMKSMDMGIYSEKIKVMGIKGGLSPTGILNLSLEDIRFPVAHLRYFSHLVKGGDGNVEGELNLKGAFSNLQVFGALSMDDAKIRLYENVREIRSISGMARFWGDSAELVDTSIRVDDANLRLEGFAEWDKSKIVNYRLDLLTATNQFFYVKRYNDIQGFLTGNCRISLADGVPLISADLSIKNMDLTYPFSQQDIGKNKHTDLAIDISIRALNNVSYFQNLNNINLQIEPGSRMRLNGSFKKSFADDDSITGLLTSQKGHLDYLGTTFTVRSARLLFSDQYHNVTPYLEFKADARVKNGNQDVMIYLEGEGLLDNDFVPRVFSSPALPRRDIVKLLGYGQLYDKIMVKTSSDEKQINLNDFSDQELNSLFLAGILTYFDETYRNVLVKPVERRIKKILRLDKLEIIPGLGENILVQGLRLTEGNTNTSFNPIATGLDNTSIVVGKYLTDFIFLEYMMNLERKDVIKLMDYNYQQHLRLEFDFKTLSFEYKYKFPLATQDSLNSPKDNSQFEIRWRTTY